MLFLCSLATVTGLTIGVSRSSFHACIHACIVFFLPELCIMYASCYLSTIWSSIHGSLHRIIILLISLHCAHLAVLTQSLLQYINWDTSISGLLLRDSH
ncbi:hypothetical protein BDR22DRAFT_383108 [Usnea florida]